MKKWIDVNASKLDSNQYFTDLILLFPDLKEKIEEEDPSMIHFRMEEFASYTIDHIKNKNWQKLKTCFDFQESKIDLVNSDLINAMNVSYCETLMLGEVAGQMDNVIPMMGTKLQRLYNEYQEYYNRLTKTS
ncbi:DUF7674 family protein [Adhaeribacter radiodurans]|uniref:DUF7674 domain-containing protein n=1 Tax=Adhaeribacter radiodurans TaxID=2745197 RepID=A0A7L7L809_9BACT|nr:hypothetical protein [Adhaeribacter radiodurans]QMU28937.1 hypothetical protein HUW48_13205 [Adhaeribacter radiodurans]